MAYIGICWDADAWEEDTWEEGIWCPLVLAEVDRNLDNCLNRRRSERDLISCLRRGEESVLVLRRPPECPDKFACPQSGCV